MKRLLMLIPVFIGATLITFLIMTSVPGDPVLTMYGVNPTANPEYTAELRNKLGLDDPIPVQYAKFLWRLLHGDLGQSIISRRPVVVEIAEALPRTIILTITSMCIAIFIGIPVGIIAAVKQGSMVDNVSMVGALLAASLPNFWLALVLIIIFSFNLRLTPVAGYGELKHIVLPSLTLGVASAGLIARFTRSSMLEVIRKDYITVARAEGLRERTVLFKYALKNALVPIVTVVGLEIGRLLGGAFFVEMIFAWPGIGRLSIQALQDRNYPVALGCISVTAIIFVIINLIVDILYAYIDPRIRYKKTG